VTDDLRLLSLHITDGRQKTNLKSRHYILVVIIQYSNRNTGTIQVEKSQKEETNNTTLNVYTTIMSWSQI
jgi:hypothetical protein